MIKYMNEALNEARKGLYEFKEVPIGCVCVYKDEIIARGHNLVNQTINATRHAEFVCIDQVLEYCQKKALNYNVVLLEIIVVVSCEPCIMCMSALFNLNVKCIVYGCKNDRFGGETVVNVAGLLSSKTKIVSGLCETEAMDLLKEFYKGENPSAPISAATKRKKK